jgi:hypothetical protein
MLTINIIGFKITLNQLNQLFNQDIIFLQLNDLLSKIKINILVSFALVIFNYNYLIKAKR